MPSIFLFPIRCGSCCSIQLLQSLVLNGPQQTWISWPTIPRSTGTIFSNYDDRSRRLNFRITQTSACIRTIVWNITGVVIFLVRFWYSIREPERNGRINITRMGCWSGYERRGRGVCKVTLVMLHLLIGNRRISETRPNHTSEEGHTKMWRRRTPPVKYSLQIPHCSVRPRSAHGGTPSPLWSLPITSSSWGSGRIGAGERTVDEGDRKSVV